MPTKSIETCSAIGKLCAVGDQACARGDFPGLRYVAYQLEDYIPEPLHCRLDELAAACIADPKRACALWDAMKDSFYRESIA